MNLFALVGAALAAEDVTPEAASAAEPAAAEPAAAPPAAAEVVTDAVIAEGWRIAPMGARSGLRIGQEAVIGRAGGTNATTLSARGVIGKNWMQVSLPFASFRTPEERAMDLGNLGIDVWGGREVKHGYRAIGVELTLPTGGHAWTWTNRPDDLWPNAGVDLVWQGTRDLGAAKLLHRVALGLHGTSAFEPMPQLWLRGQGAIGIDAPLGDRFGITGELALQTWDTSPLEVNGLFRANVIEGIDARAGVVLPVGVWAGWTPSDQAAGISETTFLVDLTMSL